MRSIIIAIFALFLASSCSLLTLQTGSDPLSRQELNTRIMTHEYVPSFFEIVSRAGDSINIRTDSREVKANVLTWKTNAASAIRKTAFQASPQVSLIDTWAMTLQMTDFFEEGNGNDLFGDQQYIAVYASKYLEAKIDTIARNCYPRGEYRSLKKFVEEYSDNNPIQDLNLQREQVRSDFLAYQGVPDSLAVTTVGGMSEVMADFSNRVMALSEQVPHQIGWEMERYVLQSGADSIDIKAYADSINMKFNEFMLIVENSPQYIDVAATALRGELELIASDLDVQVQVLVAHFAREREEIAMLIASEREIVMRDLDEITQNATKTAVQEVTNMITDFIMWITIFLAVIIMLPFGLGFMTGRIFTRNKSLKGKQPTE